MSFNRINQQKDTLSLQSQAPRVSKLTMTFTDLTSSSVQMATGLNTVMTTTTTASIDSVAEAISNVSIPPFGILDWNNPLLNQKDFATPTNEPISNFMLGYQTYKDMGLRPLVSDLSRFFTHFTHNSFLAAALFPTTQMNALYPDCPSITPETQQTFAQNYAVQSSHLRIIDIALAAFQLKRHGTQVCISPQIIEKSPTWLTSKGDAPRKLLLQIATSLHLLGNEQLANNICDIVVENLRAKNLLTHATDFINLKNQIAYSEQESKQSTELHISSKARKNSPAQAPYPAASQEVIKKTAEIIKDPNAPKKPRRMTKEELDLLNILPLTVKPESFNESRATEKHQKSTGFISRIKLPRFLRSKTKLQSTKTSVKDLKDTSVAPLPTEEKSLPTTTSPKVTKNPKRFRKFVIPSVELPKLTRKKRSEKPKELAKTVTQADAKSQETAAATSERKSRFRLPLFKLPKFTGSKVTPESMEKSFYVSYPKVDDYPMHVLNMRQRPVTPPTDLATIAKTGSYPKVNGQPSNEVIDLLNLQNYDLKNLDETDFVSLSSAINHYMDPHNTNISPEDKQKLLNLIPILLDRSTERVNSQICLETIFNNIAKWHFVQHPKPKTLDRQLAQVKPITFDPPQIRHMEDLKENLYIKCLGENKTVYLSPSTQFGFKIPNADAHIQKADLHPSKELILNSLYRDPNFHKGKYAPYAKARPITITDTKGDKLDALQFRIIPNAIPLNESEKIPFSVLLELEALGFDMYEVSSENFIKVMDRAEGKYHYIPICGRQIRSV